VLTLVGVWSLPLDQVAAQVQASPEGAPSDSLLSGACEHGAETPDCAPDQHLERDAARPARRFASYSDLGALVRSRASVGLALSPFEEGPWTRLRFEAEVITKLKDERSVQLSVRVGAMLHGRGLTGLFLGLTGSYVTRVQPGGQVLLGAELGYAHHFGGLYLCAAAGVSIEMWARAPEHDVAPSVRLLLGHAFY
jgi:hypothetical protein